MFRKLLPLICAVFPSVALAEVHENLNYSYYEVRAQADKTLLFLLNASSPVSENGQIYHGHTSWNIQWRFHWSINESGMCKITSSLTTLDSVITLPKLNGANLRQQAIFDRYFSSLKAHELGHYKLAVRTARIIDSELLLLPEMGSCSKLEAYANARSQRSLERLKEQSLQYDLDTSHGKTQGAWIDD